MSLVLNNRALVLVSLAAIIDLLEYHYISLLYDFDHQGLGYSSFRIYRCTLKRIKNAASKIKIEAFYNITMTLILYIRLHISPGFHLYFLFSSFLRLVCDVIFT